MTHIVQTIMNVCMGILVAWMIGAGAVRLARQYQDAELDQAHMLKESIIEEVYDSVLPILQLDCNYV